MQVVFDVSLMPTISISSPVWMMPCSTLPVTTVPRPVIENHVLDRHEEGLVEVALGGRDVLVDLRHEVEDGGCRVGVALQRLQRRHVDDRRVVAGELVLVEELTHLHLDELEQLLVVDHVDLVERHDDLRHTDLTGEQHVLPGLRHRTISGRNHQDRTVDLGGARDHVLDVVGVTRHVDVGVVTVFRLVLHVRHVDGDAAAHAPPERCRCSRTP